ncbi:MAG: VWA domain-containing protein [Dehalococcoidia bacterium]
MAGQNITIKGAVNARSGQDGRVALAGGGIEIRRMGKPVGGTLRQVGSVYLVIDCSSSMGGDKIAQAKKGSLDFAEQALSKRYAVGMIKFASGATHICDPQEKLSQVQQTLRSLEANGSTDMAAGIGLARVKLGGKLAPLAMVVITDGMPDDQEAALREAENAKRAGIDIITVGTDDADRSFLRKLASRNDLVVVVENVQLGRGITAAAGLLPGEPELTKPPNRLFLTLPWSRRSQERRAKSERLLPDSRS